MGLQNSKRQELNKLVKSNNEKQKNIDDEITTKYYNFYKNKLTVQLKSENKFVNIDYIHKTFFSNYEYLDQNFYLFDWLLLLKREKKIKNFNNNYILEEELDQNENTSVKRDFMNQKYLYMLKVDNDLHLRVLKTIALILRFFGLESKGENNISFFGLNICHTNDYKKRFLELNKRTDYKNIFTQLLSFLSDVGLSYLQKPILEFIIDKFMESNILDKCNKHLCNQWLNTVIDNKEKQGLIIKLSKCKKSSPEKFSFSDNSSIYNLLRKSSPY